MFHQQKTNAVIKITELTRILHSQLPGNFNLARTRFIALFICALCKVRTVCFEDLAMAFDSPATASSSLRRIQRFMAAYPLCLDNVARFIFALLPRKQGLILCMDRTDWGFGDQPHNILMLGVAYKGVAFPLLFSVLDKKGNSSSSERMALVKRFIRLFGRDCIDCLVADREFVGHEWTAFLAGHCIPYHIRLRNNFKVLLPRQGRQVKASWLFNGRPAGEFHHRHGIVYVHGVACYLSGCRLHGGGHLVLASFRRPEKAQEGYRERWQIETLFKGLKSSGFDLEKTHLKDPERLGRLLALVMMAFVWCYKAGIHQHEKVRPIKVKKHGRKAVSIFRYGLKHIANCLLNSEVKTDKNIVRFLSCT